MVGTTGGLLVPEGITHPALARGYHPPGMSVSEALLYGDSSAQPVITKNKNKNEKQKIPHCRKI
jgi:hypothetical protein